MLNDRLYFPHHIFASLALLPHPSGLPVSIDEFLRSASLVEMKIAQRRVLVLVVEMPDACDPDVVG